MKSCFGFQQQEEESRSRSRKELNDARFPKSTEEPAWWLLFEATRARCAGCIREETDVVNFSERSDERGEVFLTCV